MHAYDRPCQGGPCTIKGLAEPGFCKCKADAERIVELEVALYKAHGILGGLSMGTDGHLRRRICTVYNIVGKPLGKGRSSHGDETDE